MTGPKSYCPRCRSARSLPAGASPGDEVQCDHCGKEYRLTGLTVPSWLPQERRKFGLFTVAIVLVLVYLVGWGLRYALASGARPVQAEPPITRQLGSVVRSTVDIRNDGRGGAVKTVVELLVKGPPPTFGTYSRGAKEYFDKFDAGERRTYTPEWEIAPGEMVAVVKVSTERWSGRHFPSELR